MSQEPSRRRFLRSTAVAGALLGAAGSAAPALLAADPPAPGVRPKLRKAVKFDMIKLDGSVQQKFELARACGFEGVEINSPSNLNRDEARAAAEKTGVVIHGVIDSVHWDQRLSSPDEAVRAEGLAALRTAIDDAKFYGATTVLLVPGRVADPKNENFEQCWERSSAEVRKAIPQATDANVKIAIETVWNDFLTKPEQLIKYVDQFGTPTVGAYFDISNMIKYGVPPAQWVRRLGKRMLKFDFKGYHLQNGWVDIGEGSEDWPEVLKALADIGYDGWATSEVRGGGEDVLKDISRRMDKVLGL